jgi:carboxymethylenebutenolidase
MRAEQVTMTTVQIERRHGPIPAYVARPEGAGPWPGVVVIHDAFGAGENLERHADWLASRGFYAVAPNLFSWNRKFACIRAVMKDVAARKGRSFDDIEATRAWLGAEPNCTGRIGVIGFCMGGAFSLLLAPGGQFAAAAPNYGQVPRDADSFFCGACPIVASFGGRDPVVRRSSAERLERALSLNGVTRDVKTYPHASHGFLDDHSKDKLPLPIVVAKILLRIGPDGDAAEDAKARIETFFHTHLR